MLIAHWLGEREQGYGAGVISGEMWHQRAGLDQSRALRRYLGTAPACAGHTVAPAIKIKKCAARYARPMAA